MAYRRRKKSYGRRRSRGGRKGRRIKGYDISRGGIRL